ncbi:MAG: hypothetical protein GY708_07250 [Actinomycetia bacterium]|nr:hypothetical protein [Actinomycetes bacterium]MCP4963322.1 hypothetical protein [Actinomycetes bacterium]
MLTNRLILIDGADGEGRDWRLDPTVRERGRQGVAAARQILDSARPAFLDDAAA